MNRYLSSFIFGALTYQIFLLFFKTIIFGDQNLTRKQVRESISCNKRVRREGRNEDDDKNKYTKISDSFVYYEEKDFSERALKRTRVTQFFTSLSQGHDYVEKSYLPNPLYASQNSCKCDKFKELFGEPFDFNEIFKNESFVEENEIRKQQFEQYKNFNLHEQMAYPLLKRGPFNPIEIPSFGIHMEHLEALNLPIQIHLPKDEKIKIDLQCSYCQFGIVKNNFFKDFTEKNFNFLSRNFLKMQFWDKMQYQPRSYPRDIVRTVEETNELLKIINYYVTLFDARRLRDIVTVKITRTASGEEFEAKFPVDIHRPEMPILSVRDGDSFAERVTIVTKTFMRYDCLRRLLDSIAKFYPGVEVIVADDTHPENYERISQEKYPFVKQHRMPAESGFFAGRALAISQVTTEFFITVDDDFVLTEKTRLEDLLETIEESGYDIVGGEVYNDSGEISDIPFWSKYGRFDISSSDDGFCYYRGDYGSEEGIKMPGFPNCRARDIIKNYFIARTSTAGTIRMDPHFARTGHKEFFLDAFGHLRIAACELAPVLHDPNGCQGRSDEYKAFRFQHKRNETKEEFELESNRLWYHRNYFKCYQEHFPTTF
ncbi:Oidioi.mRNA.OKI2018_I69.chr1.g584.t1.cds [Oikopleura dioica]|uniref:Oidioi.mRNA.OKI2018_I69.chr1.g584.t1.cds n=1 Tax=Oikopleura dioica TaxID=34765 RepID=A0ABN7SPJ0_OIKDI|nr:Oidioi.mRNA.OKI2018_I69.chr1.g584.t1.cds [Oikopleura dioica]